MGKFTKYYIVEKTTYTTKNRTECIRFKEFDGEIEFATEMAAREQLNRLFALCQRGSYAKLLRWEGDGFSYRTYEDTRYDLKLISI